MDIKKPLICQAGSAEAFVGSAATGRERLNDGVRRTNCQVIEATRVGGGASDARLF